MEQTKVLEKIKELNTKQLKQHPIGIDSLALMLGVQEMQLKPLLHALETEGHIILHLNESRSRRMARSGTVEYIKA